MAKALEGVYRAKVLPFTFEKVGEKESPIMKANFQPIGQEVDGQVRVEENLPKVNKGYFLSLDIIEKGKYAGKSQIEAIKLQLEENFGYTGDFNPTTINETVPGKEVNIVCAPKEHKGKTFTDVKFVNPVGGKKDRKPIKNLSEDEIAAFGKHWGGAAKAMPPADAKSLFASLTEESNGK